MSITDGNVGMSAADLAAVLGNNRGNGFGGFGGDGAWWLIVLFLFALSGNGLGNFGGGNAAVPFMFANSNNDVQRGFDQQAVMGSLNGIVAAISNGFANAEVSRCNSQANLLQTLNLNQNAVTASLNNVLMALQNCCCENRAATADLKYTVATEACADRNAIATALNELKTFTGDGFRSINDKLCQLELDNVKQQYANVLAENNALKFAQSQTAQTAQLMANANAQTAALQQWLTNNGYGGCNTPCNCVA